jgi:hypothetical protein
MTPSFSHPLPRFWLFDNQQLPSSAPSTWAEDPASERPQLSALEDRPCLILLGEAGMGKTKSIEREVERLRSAPEAGLVQYINLKDIASRDDLIATVFDDSVVLHWLSSDENLTLWLDNLDECQLRMETVASTFSQEMRKHWSQAVARLRLRIASRPIAWPEQLTGSLRRMWPDAPAASTLDTQEGATGVSRWRICPLHSQDAKALAAAEGLDGDEFWALVERMGAQRLTARPRTLIQLLTLFRKGEIVADQPLTRYDLFYRSTLDLCSDPSRRGSELPQKLMPEDRQRIAARLAAFSILTGRSRLAREMPFGQDSEERELSFGQVLGTAFLDGESSAESLFLGDNPLRSWDGTREVLDTPLFDAGTEPDEAGQDRRLYWFAQRTDAEFLAAWYLLSCDLKDEQMLSVLSHSVPDVLGWDEPRLAPQLVEVAAWLGSQRPSLRAALLEREPRAMLRSDLSAWPDKDKAALVDALLQGIQAEKFFDDTELRSHYDRFDHEHLADQLAGFIFNRKLSIFTRRAAVDIAEKCRHAQTLSPRLAKLALDDGEGILIRIQAAYAVARIGDGAARESLCPLALHPPQADTSNELQGAALTAAWPAHLSAREVFSVLKPPRDELIGAYRAFLWKLPASLQPEDLPVALAWCAWQRRSFYIRDAEFDLQRLIGGILSRAGEVLGDPDTPAALKPRLARAFAAALATRLRQHDLVRVWGATTQVGMKEAVPPAGFSALADEQRRMVVAQMVLRLRRQNGLRSLVWTHGAPIWLYPRDLPWLLEQLKPSTLQLASLWAHLARIVFEGYALEGDEEAVELLHRTFADAQHPHRPVIVAEFGEWFIGMALDSPRARSLKEHHERNLQFLREQEQQQTQLKREQEAAQQRLLQDVEAYLGECEAGNAAQWWRIDFALVHDRAENDVLGETVGVLTSSRTWQQSDQAMRGRLLAAAEAYLRDLSPQDLPGVRGDWATSTTFYRPVAASHRALLLLFLEEPDRFDALPDETLARWAAVPVWFPWHGGEPWEQGNAELMKALTARVPDAVADAVEIQAREESRRHGHIFVLRKLNFPWPSALFKRLLSLAQAPSTDSATIYHLLSVLLDREAVPLLAARIAAVEAGARLPSESKLSLPAHDLAGQLFEAVFEGHNPRVRRTTSTFRAPKKARSPEARPDATYTTRGERAAQIALAMLG